MIFSLQWRPYWVHLPLRWRLAVAYFSADLNYVTFVRRFPDPKPAPEQWPYFWGGVAVNWGSWQLSSLLGIALAHHLPMQWGLGFAGTTALLALTYTLGVRPRDLDRRRAWPPAPRWRPMRCRCAEHPGGDRRGGRGGRADRTRTAQGSGEGGMTE